MGRCADEHRLALKLLSLNNYETNQIRVDTIDRCRADYRLEDYAGQPCNMGVDVGTKLHVVVRERSAERRHQDALNTPRRLWFAGELAWDDLEPLMNWFNVERCLIDAQPEIYQASTFARSHYDRAAVAPI